MHAPLGRNNCALCCLILLFLFISGLLLHVFPHELFYSVLQPPAFPRETPESIKEYIEEKYLLPRLDPDIFSPEKAGRQWEFDWFEKAKIHLDPSLPRSVMVPTWELPFRRPRRGSELEKYEPSSVQVTFFFTLLLFVMSA